MTEPNDPWNRFDEEERITANLRLGSESIPARNRTFLGFVALIPPKWRGPVILFGMAIIGFLAGNMMPDVANWVRNLNK